MRLFFRFDPADVCVLSTGQTEVTIGEQTSVCLVVNGLQWTVDDSAATFYSQVLILPDADEFSRFSVKGCEFFVVGWGVRVPS